jgi:hypothetical protein
MNREKFPEKVPFRLTRMMVKAMEVSGIEGNFRWAVWMIGRGAPSMFVAAMPGGQPAGIPLDSIAACPHFLPAFLPLLCPPSAPLAACRATCNEVMRVLRSNKDSVMAMLEAFVHDPLINWRLLNTGDNLPDAAPATPVAGAHAGGGSEAAAAVGGAVAASVAAAAAAAAVTASSGAEAEEAGSSAAAAVAAAAAAALQAPGVPADLRTGPPSPPRRDLTREQVLAAYGGIGDATEVLNERAVAVMKRMSDKLTGRDAVAEGMVAPSESDSVAQQVQRLITLATSNEALCQSYIGELGWAKRLAMQLLPQGWLAGWLAGWLSCSLLRARALALACPVHSCLLCSVVGPSTRRLVPLLVVEGADRSADKSKHCMYHVSTSD